MLPLTAILVASEAITASEQPQRSNLFSKSKSVTSITYDAMLLWPLRALMSSIKQRRGDLSSIDLRGFPAGKNSLF